MRARVVSKRSICEVILRLQKRKAVFVGGETLRRGATFCCICKKVVELVLKSRNPVPDFQGLSKASSAAERAAPVVEGPGAPTRRPLRFYNGCRREAARRWEFG